MTQTTQKEKTLLSPRIPRDTEHERYHPELEEELKECLFCLHRNEMMFDLEVDTDLIEQHIYERQALLARYRYLLGKARELGLHTILEKYQPVGSGFVFVQPLSLTSFDSSPSRGASGEETKLYAMPRPPLLGEVASSVSDDDGEVS